MIIKGRSPALRHVVRTHRVDLDFVCECIRDDRGVTIRFISTKQQIADMLTKGQFTGAQWQHLMRLAQIINVEGNRRSPNSKPSLAKEIAPTPQGNVPKRPRPKSRNKSRNLKGTPVIPSFVTRPTRNPTTTKSFRMAQSVRLLTRFPFVAASSFAFPREVTPVRKMSASSNAPAHPSPLDPQLEPGLNDSLINLEGYTRRYGYPGAFSVATGVQATSLLPPAKAPPKQFVAPRVEITDNPRIVPLPPGADSMPDWGSKDEFMQALDDFERHLGIASSTPDDPHEYWVLHTKVTAESMLNLIDSQTTKLGYREIIKNRTSDLREQIDMCCRMVETLRQEGIAIFDPEMAPDSSRFEEGKPHHKDHNSGMSLNTKLQAFSDSTCHIGSAPHVKNALQGNAAFKRKYPDHCDIDVADGETFIDTVKRMYRYVHRKIKERMIKHDIASYSDAGGDPLQRKELWERQGFISHDGPYPGGRPPNMPPMMPQSNRLPKSSQPMPTPNTMESPPFGHWDWHEDEHCRFLPELYDYRMFDEDLLAITSGNGSWVDSSGNKEDGTLKWFIGKKKKNRQHIVDAVANKQLDPQHKYWADQYALLCHAISGNVYMQSPGTAKSWGMDYSPASAELWEKHQRLLLTYLAAVTKRPIINPWPLYTNLPKRSATDPWNFMWSDSAAHQLVRSFFATISVGEWFMACMPRRRVLEPLSIQGRTMIQDKYGQQLHAPFGGQYGGLYIDRMATAIRGVDRGGGFAWFEAHGQQTIEFHNHQNERTRLRTMFPDDIREKVYLHIFPAIPATLIPTINMAYQRTYLEPNAGVWAAPESRSTKSRPLSA